MQARICLIKGLLIQVSLWHIPPFFLQELYSRSYEDIGVVFASIPHFTDVYMQVGSNQEGVELLKLLNEIIADIDEVSWIVNCSIIIGDIDEVSCLYFAC